MNTTIVRPKYETVTTREQLKAWIDKITKAGFVAIDTETDSLDPHVATLAGISLSTMPGEGCYIPVGHTTGEAQLPLIDVLDFGLKFILENPCIVKILHNAKYDMAVFNRYGLACYPIEDTMLQSYAMNGGKHRHNMDELADLYLNHTTIKIKELIGSGANQITFNDVDLAPATQYAAEDADVTMGFYGKFDQMLDLDERSRRVYDELEKPLVQVIFEMEREGILVDVPYLNNLTEVFGKRMDEQLDRAYAIAGTEFNPASPQQVGAVFEKMGIDTGELTDSGQMATGAKVLEDVQNNGNISAEGKELISAILEWRKFAKLIGTYTSALPQKVNPVTGRVHTSFGLASTTTGRLASSDPNLQNIPIRTDEGKELRKAFVAKPGHKLIAADYSQIELRILAVAARDKNMLAAFEAGHDIHAAMAALLSGKDIADVSKDERRNAKAVNFGIAYGTSSYGLARNLGIPVEEAERIIEGYFNRFPGILSYMQNAKAFARKWGFVRTRFGRRIWIPDINSRNKAKRGHAERAAVNAPIQGTAADVVKKAMIDMRNKLSDFGFDRPPMKTKLLLQVHDELIFEAPEDEVERVKELCYEVMPKSGSYIGAPLLVEVGVGDNWGEAH
jgi:DNA polymerase-1